VDAGHLTGRNWCGNLDRHANYIVAGFIEDSGQEHPTV